MLDTAPPKIYVSKVPDAETTSIPSDAVELTSGVDGYMVNSSIDGLARPDAEIARSTLAGVDASRISGRQIPYRNIVLDVIPMPEINTNRERLYNILPYGETLRFYFEKRGKVVFIDGEIEKMDGTFAPGKLFRFGVSIICPFPWFQSVKLHTVNLTKNVPTKVANDGDIPCGINFYVPGTYESTASHIREFVIDINGEKFSTDVGNIIKPPVTVSTIPGKKKYLASATIPAFATLSNGSKWVTLAHGSNVVTLDYFEVLGDADPADTNGIAQNVFRWRDTYSGV